MPLRHCLRAEDTHDDEKHSPPRRDAEKQIPGIAASAPEVGGGGESGGGGNNGSSEIGGGSERNSGSGGKRGGAISVAEADATAAAARKA